MSIITEQLMMAELGAEEYKLVTKTDTLEALKKTHMCGSIHSCMYLITHLAHGGYF